MPNGQPWPLVSVVTPSYNQGTYIEEAIRSLLLQGYPNLEYVVIDGGSSDATVDILRKYSPWITHWVSEPDRGQAHALNKGFANSRGDILAWLNSDDTYEPSAIAAVFELFFENPETDVVYGNARIIDERSATVTELRSVPFDAQAFFYETVHITAQSAVFWRADIFRRVGLLDESLRYAMDRDLLVRFITNGARCRFLRRILGTYRCHTASKTFGTSAKSREELRSLEPFATLTDRPGYEYRRLLYRLRQFALLAWQGDISYLLARASARLRPTAFDRQ